MCDHPVIVACLRQKTVIIVQLLINKWPSFGDDHVEWLDESGTTLKYETHWIPPKLRHLHQMIVQTSRGWQ